MASIINIFGYSDADDCDIRKHSSTVVVCMLHGEFINVVYYRCQKTESELCLSFADSVPNEILRRKAAWQKVCCATTLGFIWAL